MSKEFLVFFNGVQVNSSPLIYISEARQLLSNERRKAKRNFNYDRDYISIINPVEIQQEKRRRL